MAPKPDGVAVYLSNSLPSALPYARSATTTVLLFLGLVYATDGEIPYPDYIYPYIEDWRPTIIWELVVGFVLAFALSFSVGANDCANSLGTAVGSGVMTLKMACICGTIFETIGAVFLSGNVIELLTTGLLNIEDYKTQYNETTMTFDPPINGTGEGKNFTTFDPEVMLMLGEIGVISGSALWQIIASLLAWPVSSSHSVIGALLGFALVANGTHGINWSVLIKIVIAWVASPLLATLFSIALYYPIRKFIVMADDPLKYGLIAFPLLWGFAGFLNAGVILTTGDIFYDLTGLSKGVLWGISAGFGLAVLIAVAISVKMDWWGFSQYQNNDKPEQQIKSEINKAFPEVNNEIKKEENDEEEDPDVQVEEIDPDEDGPETRHLFRALLWVSACSGAMAHGGNNVGNAVGPAILMWLIYQTPLTFEVEDPPFWILLYGGIGISVGLWILGHKTIETVGKDLAKVTPSRGFCVEIMCAVTVQICTVFGFPISTTQCKVGSVVGIGMIRGVNEVNLKLFYSIAAAWVITIPASALVSAGIYEILYLIVF